MSLLSAIIKLTFGKEVGPGAVLPDVEVLPQLVGGFEPLHGVVVESVVPEQHTASWLQHLRQTHTEEDVAVPCHTHLPFKGNYFTIQSSDLK